MSHNNSICKFRNYSRDSSLAAHDFSTKFRRHLFYRGQPSPAFRGAESVRRQLSRGGRQTAAQKRGWGGEVRETDADGKTKVGMLAKAQRGVRAAAQRAISDSNTEAGMRAEVRETDADGKTEVGMLAEAQRGMRAAAQRGVRATAQRGVRATAQRGVRATAQRGVRATAQRAATDDGTERCAGGARRADTDGGTEAGIVAGAQRRNADGRGGARQPAGRRG